MKNIEVLIYNLGLVLLSVFVYFLLKVFSYRFLVKLNDKWNASEKDILEVKKYIIRFLNISIFLIIFNIIIKLPYLGEFINKYFISILKTSIIETEALKISTYSIIKGGLVFYTLFLITKITRKITEIYFFHKEEEDFASTVDILIYHTTLIIIFLISLSTIGITWKLLIPIAGALGIGIGFGIQDIVNNLISGFIILLSKTIKRGDWITVGDNFGKVVDIGIRTSTLRTLDNIDIIIPNSNIISNQLINWSHTDPVVRVHVPVGVSYGSDVNLVKETLLEVAKDTHFILESPSPEVRFMEFGNSSLNFELLVWINVKKIPIFLAKSELNFKIWNAFKEKGIEIPFPQRDVWFKNKLVVETLNKQQ